MTSEKRQVQLVAFMDHRFKETPLISEREAHNSSQAVTGKMMQSSSGISESKRKSRLTSSTALTAKMTSCSNLETLSPLQEKK